MKVNSITIPRWFDRHLHVRDGSETMTIERGTLVVPQKVGGVQVFKGGAELPWKLVG